MSKIGGMAIIGTFALAGLAKCSGLPVERYWPETIATLLGSEFEIAETTRELHRTRAVDSKRSRLRDSFGCDESRFPKGDANGTVDDASSHLPNATRPAEVEQRG